LSFLKPVLFLYFLLSYIHALWNGVRIHSNYIFCNFLSFIGLFKFIYCT
jgi:hypothetical protein